MFTIRCDDVNDALQRGIEYLLREGIEETSRNGKVLVAPGPVTTEYLNPRNRVLLAPTRDANPFFHLHEALWFLEGGNDIEVPVYFNKNFSQYSDDGRTLWDAYGWRWRRFFGWDQLEVIITELKVNPSSRRCVLSMWSPRGDGSNAGFIDEEDGEVIVPNSKMDDFYVATHGGKAVPCNTHAYFDLRGGALNMTVCNRSNDIIWGCYGANVVHMSFLQEYLAMRIGAPVGVYRQMSNNFHVYLNTFPREVLEKIAFECDTLGALPATGPALDSGFDEDLAVFMRWARDVIHSTAQEETALNAPSVKTAFMESVAVPMLLAWTYRKWKDEYSMNICLDSIEAPDWQRACREWVERRRK